MYGGEFVDNIIVDYNVSMLQVYKTHIREGIKNETS